MALQLPPWPQRKRSKRSKGQWSSIRLPPTSFLENDLCELAVNLLLLSRRITDVNKLPRKFLHYAKLKHQPVSRQQVEEPLPARELNQEHGETSDGPEDRQTVVHTQIQEQLPAREFNEEQTKPSVESEEQLVLLPAQELNKELTKPLVEYEHYEPIVQQPIEKPRSIQELNQEQSKPSAEPEYHQNIVQQHIEPQARIVALQPRLLHPLRRHKDSYVCPECGEFHCYQALGGHKTKHRKPVMSSDKAGTSSGGADSKPHKCPICEMTFSIGQALGGHMSKHFRRGVNARKYGVDRPASGSDMMLRELASKSEKIELEFGLNHLPLPGMELGNQLGSLFSEESKKTTGNDADELQSLQPVAKKSRINEKSADEQR